MGILDQITTWVLGVLAVLSAGAAFGASPTTASAPATQPDTPAALLEAAKGEFAYLAFSPDRRWLYSKDGDGTLRKWDIAHRKEVWNYKTAGGQVCLSPDGALLGICVEDGKAVSLLSAADGKEFKKMPALDAKDPFISSISFSHDSQSVYASVLGSGHRRWAWKKDKLEPVFQDSGTPTGLGGIDTSKDGRFFANHRVYDPETLLVFDLQNPGRVKSTPAQTGCPVYSGAMFSPDGRIIATASYDGGTEYWETLTLLPLSHLKGKGHLADCRDVAFSPDNRWFACCEDGKVNLISVADGSELASLKTSDARFVAVSPDGSMLAAAGDGNAISLWDLRKVQQAMAWPAAPAREKLISLWDALASEDASEAWKARQALSAGGEATVAFLKDHLKPATAPDAKKVASLITDLDSDKFPVRKTARQQLAALGHVIDDDLKAALKKSPSLEVRESLESLLEEGIVSSGPQRKACRAVAVLEDIASQNAAAGKDSDAARALLKALADGVANAEVTVEAQASLKSLGHAPATSSPSN